MKYGAINNQYRQWIMQITRDIPIFSRYDLHCCTHVFCTLYILEGLFLAAPPEYVHSGLILGLD
jgi:hypothetical protein